MGEDLNFVSERHHQIVRLVSILGYGNARTLIANCEKTIKVKA